MSKNYSRCSILFHLRNRKCVCSGVRRRQQHSLGQCEAIDSPNLTSPTRTERNFISSARYKKFALLFRELLRCVIGVGWHVHNFKRQYFQRKTYTYIVHTYIHTCGLWGGRVYDAYPTCFCLHTALMWVCMYCMYVCSGVGAIGWSGLFIASISGSRKCGPKRTNVNGDVYREGWAAFCSWWNTR